jgi:hypothetical protein
MSTTFIIQFGELWSVNFDSSRSRLDRPLQPLPAARIPCEPLLL